MDTVHGSNLGFPKVKEKKWIQILHDGMNHWVTAYKAPDEDFVKIYDRLEHEDNLHVIACISALLRHEGDSISYAYVKCQIQNSGVNCGVFAIAFAVSLITGGDPTNDNFASDTDLRQHLKKCLSDGKMSPFPKTTEKVKMKRSSKVKSTKIFCHCRLVKYDPLNDNPDWPSNKKREKRLKNLDPDARKKAKSESKWNYIQCSNTACKQWYHWGCEEVSDEDKSDKKKK